VVASKLLRADWRLFVTIRLLLLAAAFPWMATQDSQAPPDVLPARAVSTLAASLSASARHTKQVWRDMAPLNPDGTVNGYIEIARGDRRKWEFDIAANARRIDRMMPADIGGYPVNYGFVPQTVSYDGDPFDILVLGPPIEGGSVVRGRAVGVMFMEDEKGLDSKVVVSRLGRDGQPLHQLTAAIQKEIGDFFNRYKENQPGAFSKVPGWGTADVGLDYVRVTHRFFLDCRKGGTAPCRIPRG
jgi:inorganic pyrophosphatase